MKKTLKKKKGFGEVARLKKVKTIKEYGSYDQERAFITSILEDGNFIDVITSRVDSSWFADEYNRKYFSWIEQEFNKHSKVPGIARFEENFPDFIGLKTGDAVGELVAAMRDKKMYQEVASYIKRTTEQMRDDPAGAARGMSEHLTALMGKLSESPFLPISKARGRIKERYLEAKNSKGKTGFQTPWAAINETCPGWKPGQYHVFYGKPGTMKTFLSLYLAEWFCKTVGQVGFITMEMVTEEIEQRFAAQTAGFDFDLVELGELSPKQEKAFFKSLDGLEGSGFHIAEPVTSGPALLQEIDARIMQHPEIKVWILDGLGMAQEGSDWEGFLELQKKLSRLCIRRKIVLIAIHHTNQELVKEGDENNAADVGGGTGVHKYVHGLYRLRRTDQNREDEETRIEVVKMRNGSDQVIFTVHAKPGVTFEQKAVLKRPKPRGERVKESAGEDETL